METGYVWALIQLLAIAVQLLTIRTRLWKYRFNIFIQCLLIQLISAIALIKVSGLLAIISGLILLYLLLDTYRVIKAYQSESYLKTSVFHNQLRLGTFLAVVWMVAAWHPVIGNFETLLILALCSYIIAGVLLLTTIRSLLRARVAETRVYADKDLPTLTLAFPARNETVRIAETLKGALASDYPKLEILVLDDCSQDDTPHIVQTYAHDGIRFISGSTPKPHWLGKNWAYERLIQEASGDYILFAGIDIHMSPESIRHLVSYALDKHADMVSVMPRRDRFHFQEALLAPPRYFWQLAMPRYWRRNPPVLSSVWLIKKDVLDEIGGMEAVSNKIIPEQFFARELAKKHAYRFLVSNYFLALRTHKSFVEQLETEHRILYPEMRRRPSRVFVASAILMIGMLMPFIATVAGFWLHLGPAHRVFMAAAAMLVLTHVLTTTVLYPSSWPFSVFNFPIVMLLELVTLNYSMLQYEFNEVTWKGRNICIPAMNHLEVIPSLPQLPRRKSNRAHH